MGEKRARGEGILGGFVENEVCLMKDERPLNPLIFVHLYSFRPAKFKYAHGQALGYNQGKFSSTLEATLMIKNVNGEKKYEFDY